MTTQPTALDTYLLRPPRILDKIEALRQLADDQFSRDPDGIHWGHVGDLGRVFIAIFSTEWQVTDILPTDPEDRIKVGKGRRATN